MAKLRTFIDMTLKFLKGSQNLVIPDFSIFYFVGSLPYCMG